MPIGAIGNNATLRRRERSSLRTDRTLISKMLGQVVAQVATGRVRPGDIERAMSSRWAAYSDGLVPRRTTRSSQACSCAACRQRAAIQINGLNQWSAQVNCAIIRISQSFRWICDNSCISTCRRRSIDHEPGSAGRSIVGLKSPYVNGTLILWCSSSLILCDIRPSEIS